jgi:4-hydroxy-2-oxoheptanedioate aldolase
MNRFPAGPVTIFGGKRMSSDTAEILRARLQAQEPTFIMAIRCWGGAEAVHAAAKSGHHAIYVDLQHGPLTIETAASLCLTAIGLGLPALVRLPSTEPSLIGRILDNGATGLLLPDIETEAQAAAIVAAAYHPPVGRRSLGGPRGFAPVARPFIAPMIESPNGVAASAAIAALSGIDALMIGSGDLAASLGEKPGEGGTLAATRQVIAHAGRVPVIVAGLRDVNACKAMRDEGAANCFVIGTDLGYLFTAATGQVAAFSKGLT